MQVSLYVTEGICQLVSYWKYKKVLPLWDSLLQLYPQRFISHLRRLRVIIWVMVTTMICSTIPAVASGCYLILMPDPNEAYIKLAEPWSGSIKKARIAYITNAVYFLPPYITWTSAGMLFVVATYYLRCGFRDLRNTIASDTQLVDHLALHKRTHMRLSQMTRDLDDILWGYNGVNVAMCTINLCFVIFTLHDSNSFMETTGSISILFMSVIIMTIIVVLSISINTWVSGNIV